MTPEVYCCMGLVLCVLFLGIKYIKEEKRANTACSIIIMQHKAIEELRTKLGQESGYNSHNHWLLLLGHLRDGLGLDTENVSENTQTANDLLKRFIEIKGKLSHRYMTWLCGYTILLLAASKEHHDKMDKLLNPLNADIEFDDEGGFKIIEKVEKEQ